MGVIYESADDVAELLVPFVSECGGTSDVAAIQREYIAASLGKISAARFWRHIGVSPSLEDVYLARHRLRDGFDGFLRRLPSEIASLWCLSNDVSEWSRKLRNRNGLEQYFAGFLISGDVGFRKPSVEIFESLLSRVKKPPAECIFVDDRPSNLDAARQFGFRTILFGHPSFSHAVHLSVANFSELASFISHV
jgi:HAD superfamily hydrolase (TIGR01509 family)